MMDKLLPFAFNLSIARYEVQCTEHHWSLKFNCSLHTGPNDMKLSGSMEGSIIHLQKKFHHATPLHLKNMEHFL